MTREDRFVALGGGLRVPYPEPVSRAATTIGKANRRTDTKPEKLIRSALHGEGYRFRKDHLLRVGETRCKPDIVFTRKRVVVFVDGCFWHSCPQHGNTPRSNVDYWGPKLQRNAVRDRAVDLGLQSAGWAVVRVWEHEDLGSAVEKVVRVLQAADENDTMTADREG